MSTYQSNGQKIDIKTFWNIEFFNNSGQWEILATYETKEAATIASKGKKCKVMRGKQK